MNSYNGCNLVAYKSKPYFARFLKYFAHEGRFVFTREGGSEIDEYIQKYYGDVLLEDEAGQLYAWELKAEENNPGQKPNYRGNFFCETWSNLQENHHNPGWMYTTRADNILYHFQNTVEMYMLNVRKLKNWFFFQGNIALCPRVTQGKNSQLNITQGHLVPIQTMLDLDIATEVPQEYFLDEDELKTFAPKEEFEF